LTGLSPLAPRYDGFVVDLWGVIHDGVTPYPGAVETLRRLRAAGKRVVLLSNAPRRAAVAAEGLRQLGITSELYDLVVTSGEATWVALGEMPGTRIYHLGPARDESVLRDRHIMQVERPREADLLLNTGPDADAAPVSVANYVDELCLCLEAGLPMICVNPDLEIVSAGRRLICAGALAQWYEANGGKVRWIGKPYPEVYNLVWPALEGIARTRVLAVGDALRTDIAGAQAVSVDSCWVLGGIHAHDDPETASREAVAAGLSPVATLPSFVW
jgi:HAD superfamily hydrolase (TIGR01459 family)